MQSFPPNLAAISSAYDDPPLFSTLEASEALDRIVLESLGRRGLWDAVSAFSSETSLEYPADKRTLSEELHGILDDISRGDLTCALDWCRTHADFLAAAPPSSLPYHLHRARILALPSPANAIAYARDARLDEYIGSQPVLSLITSCLYKDKDSPYTNDAAPLAAMFRNEFCRLHGWAREEPLDVAVTLGSRGGALNAIEKARRVMGDRLGSVRTWQELPVSTWVAEWTWLTHPDGGAPPAVEAIPLRLCLPGLQGADNRDQPAHDARVRPRHCAGITQPSRQGCTPDVKVPILPRRGITGDQPTSVLLTLFPPVPSVLCMHCQQMPVNKCERVLSAAMNANAGYNMMGS